jgi:hypothetical protein
LESGVSKAVFQLKGLPFSKNHAKIPAVEVKDD